MCDNWRGITLLSVPSKVISKILLKRINEKLREKQEVSGKEGGA
jgi:hypothetical protein